MKKDHLHWKIIATAIRQGDEDGFEEDVALRYSTKNEDSSWRENLKNFSHQPVP